MSAIDRLFEELRSKNQKALMPFITAGDPDLDFTSAMIGELARRGCQLCEIGFPYSDPIADGPVIQASYTRALARGVKVPAIFEAIGRATSRTPMPAVAMASYAIIYRYGLKRFVDDAQRAGISGVIVPDLPVDEASAMAKICRDADFSLIQLVTPTTPRERALRIAQSTTGFIYYVSVTGITGERKQLPADLVENVSWLRGQTPLPVCIGFGISEPEHVRQLAPVADGLIVGSAIMRRIAESAGRRPAQAIQSVGDYVASLVAALSQP